MKPFFLTEDFDRVRRLSGLPPLTETEKLEKLLYEVELDLYCLQNNVDRNLLTEGFLDSVKNKIQSAVSTFTGKSDQEKKSLGEKLVRRLKNLVTDKGYKQVVKIIKDYEGSKNIKEIGQYLEKELKKLHSINEGLQDWFYKPDEEGKERELKTGYKILFYLMIATTVLGVFDLKTDLDNDDIDDVDFADTSGETEVGFPFDTGEFELSDNEKSSLINLVVNQILDLLDGGEFSSESKIVVTGNVSNTGAGYDNPNGSQETGLGDLRAQVGMDLAPDIAQNLLDQAPDQFPGMSVEKIVNTFVNGGSNADNPGPEVEKGSEEAQQNQSTMFDLENVKSSGDSDGKITAPPFPELESYLRNPREIFPDMSKYYVIMTVILPLITNMKQPSDEVIQAIVGDEDNPTLNDNFVQRTLSRLAQDDSEASKKAKAILTWARKVKKQPQSIGKFINNLDSKIDIQWEKRRLDKPGVAKKGAVQGTNVKEPTIQPTLGELRKNLFEELLEGLLNEATVGEWTSLPDYNSQAAKHNLGILVPIYVYVWDLQDTGAIKYVGGKNSPYKESFSTFYNKYPKFKEKVSADLKYLDAQDSKGTDNPNDDSGGDGNPDNSKRKITAADKKAGDYNVQKDVYKLINKLLSNERVTQTLKKINRKEEFEQLIISIFEKLDNFDKDSIDNALNRIKIRYTPPISERVFKEQGIGNKKQTVDNKRFETVVSALSVLRPYFSKINTVEEVTQLFLLGIIPSLDPVISNNTGTVKGVLDRAIKYFKGEEKNKSQEKKVNRASNQPRDKKGRFTKIQTTQQKGGQSLQQSLQGLDENIIGKKEKFLLKNLYK